LPTSQVQAPRVACKKEVLPPNLCSFNIAIDRCAKQGDLAGAEIWFAKLCKAGFTPELATYDIIMDACLKAENAAAAERWFAQMIDAEHSPNEMSYATLIHVNVKQGAVDKAEQWLQKMLSEGIKPDIGSYNMLISACKETEAKESGKETKAKLNVLPECKAEPNAASYNAMIESFAEAGDTVHAEFWHRKMFDQGLKPSQRAFSMLISACAKAGDVVAASLHLMSMEKAQILTDVAVYSSILDACAKAGDAERAEQLFKRMQSVGIHPDAAAYTSLAQSIAHRGDWNELERLAETMTKQGHLMNNDFLSALLISYAAAYPPQAQRAEEAFWEGCAKGITANCHGLDALRCAVGLVRYKQLTSMKKTPAKEPSPRLKEASGTRNGSMAMTNDQVRWRTVDHGKYDRAGKYPCYIKAGKSKAHVWRTWGSGRSRTF